MDISFVILTYNSDKHIEACIGSYVNSLVTEKLEVEFFVVDNGSTDQTLELIEKKIFPGLPDGIDKKLIKLPKNCGTTISRNLALREARGEYIVICDADTELKQGEWTSMLEYLKTHDSVGMLVPGVYYENGFIQETVRLFPCIQDKMLKLGKIFLNLSSDRFDFYPDFPWDDVRAIDTAASAFWLFKRLLIAEVGYLDERIFYAPEDVDYCLRIWKASREIRFYPHFKITHKLQRLSHRNPFGFHAWIHFKGLLYFFYKHGYMFSRKKVYKEIGRSIKEQRG